jgi:hypothetical protein
MGTRASLSTLGADSPWGWFAPIRQSSDYMSAFSGKLSPVTIKAPSKPEQEQQTAAAVPAPATAAREFGGREGPEPTRFGDWELRGRCIDF